MAGPRTQRANQKDCNGSSHISVTPNAMASFTAKAAMIKSRNSSSLRTIILCLFFGVICFYFGLLMGSIAKCSCPMDVSSTTATMDASKQQRQQEQVPSEMQDIVKGFSGVDRDEFAAAFDMGVPLDKSSSTNRQVLVVHNSYSLPN